MCRDQAVVSESVKAATRLRRRYNQIWRTMPQYRRHSPELKLLRHLDMAKWRRDMLPRILSVGCGAGQGFRYLMKHGYDAHGCDVADGLADWYSDCPERFTVASADALPYKDAEFNVALSVDVLEHLPRQMVAGALREISRVARNVLILGVCCVPSQLVEGLHLTVKSPGWWLRMFERLGMVTLVNGNSVNLAVVIEKEPPRVIAPPKQIIIPGRSAGA